MRKAGSGGDGIVIQEMFYAVGHRGYGRRPAAGLLFCVPLRSRYVSWRALATFARAARVAGTMPPNSPRLQAIKIEITTNEGVMLNE
jgi:hypothetical protein